MSDGTIERSAERVVFRYERQLSQVVAVVWRAIIDPEQNESWFGGRVEIELEPGGSFI